MSRRLNVERRREVATLSLTGLSQRAIASRLGCSLSSVNRIVRAHREEGRLEDAPRSGRPPATTTEEDQQIVAVSAVEPFFTSTDNKRELGLGASAKTVQRRLKAFQSGVAVQKALLKADHEEARLQFALDHMDWDDNRMVQRNLQRRGHV
ncbi:uncharacterized protein LOC135398481 [Ornithodoros turicata]|uniref:uncharacterized protein LOC135398481 n=1 Tax=Ornithodoros turicata TaxID=34597 RepID=UPI00313918D7